MAYQSLNTYGGGSPQAIYLYTTPLRFQKKIFKKPIDVFAHWAICIEGRCYELTRNDGAGKKEPKYHMNATDEQDWLFKKEKQGRGCEKEFAGYTARPLSSKTITDIAQKVWDKSLRSKYVYDENNCQVFIRLLVDLIGDPKTKAEFPQYFDKWVKRVGISRDASIMVFAAGTSAVVATMSLAVTPVDPTGTAAAGFALSSMTALRSSAALLTDRHSKQKFIEKAQTEIREELRSEGIVF